MNHFFILNLLTFLCLKATSFPVLSRALFDDKDLGNGGYGMENLGKPELEEGGIYSDIDYYEDSGELFHHFLDKTFGKDGLFGGLFGGFGGSEDSGNSNDGPNPSSNGNNESGPSTNGNGPFGPPNNGNSDPSGLSNGEINMPSSKTIPPMDPSSGSSEGGMNIPSTKTIPPMDPSSGSSEGGMNIPSTKTIPPNDSSPESPEGGMDIPEILPGESNPISNLPPKNIPSSLPPKNVPSSVNGDNLNGPGSLIPEYDSADPNEVFVNPNDMEEDFKYQNFFI